MSDPSNETPVSPPSVRKPALTGWRLAVLIVGIFAVVGRLLLAVLSHHGNLTTPAAKQNAGSLPAWPLKVGDVFTVKPGDPAIAKWAEAPDSDGFLVQQLEQEGEPVTDGRVCALEPEYMADAAQPGGTLTLVSQDGAGDWVVRWSGGDTMPVEVANTRTANCGKSAVILMSFAQLHTWLNMQSGILEEKTPESDGTAH